MAVFVGFWVISDLFGKAFCMENYLNPNYALDAERRLALANVGG